MKTFRNACLLLISSWCGRHAVADSFVPYQIQGQARLENFERHGVPKGEVEHYNYVVSVSPQGWRIGLELRGTSGYRVTGSTNVNQTFLVRKKGSLAEELRSERGTSKGAPLFGVIQKSPLPLGNMTGIAPYLFMMFASRPYLESREERDLIPFWEPSVQPGMDMAWRMQGRWRQMPGNPQFCESLDIDAGGTVRLWSGELIVRERHPPYDAGFLRARMRMLGVMDIKGREFPSGYTFEILEPKPLGAGVEDLIVRKRVTAQVASVKLDPALEPGLPELTANSAVIDTRFKDPDLPDRPLAYVTTNGNWLSSNEVLRLQGELSDRDPEASRDSVRFMFRAILCALGIVGLALLVMSRKPA